MDEPSQLTEYGKILLFAIVGLLLVLGTIFLAKVISPKKSNPIKDMSYECGETPTGTAWFQFNPRFYIIALIFLLFDVELIFIFPWSTVFGRSEIINIDQRWGWFALIEMGLFVGILLIGLVYVWRRGDLNWIKPTHHVPTVEVGIPASAYNAINNREYVLRDFKEALLPKKDIVENTLSELPASEDSPKKVPSFKPRFKKS